MLQKINKISESDLEIDENYPSSKYIQLYDELDQFEHNYPYNPINLLVRIQLL